MTEQESIERARQHVEERGWPWREPVQATPVSWKGVGAYRIVTNVGRRGINAAVIVASDGSILHSEFMPR